MAVAGEVGGNTSTPTSPSPRTLGTHIWRAGAWHELPTELDAVISLLGLARRQRDAAIEGLILAKSALERGTHQDFQDETFADISTILESLKLPFSKPSPDLARKAASADRLASVLKCISDGHSAGQPMTLSMARVLARQALNEWSQP